MELGLIHSVGTVFSWPKNLIIIDIVRILDKKPPLINTNFESKMGKNLNHQELNLQTKALHADRDLESDRGIAPPIAQSVTYFADDEKDFAEKATDPMFDHFYARHGNPTSSRVARVIASLEGAEAGMMFSAGMGAITSTVMAFVKQGDHVVAQNCHYIGTTNLITQMLPDYGVEVTQVDQRNPEQFEQAIQSNTKILLTETPVNPTMHITDLAEVAKIAKERDVVTMCDNTFATPINQRPIELGIDLVCHSVTKYIGGHHDLLAGCVVGSNENLQKIWNASMVLGAIGAPFNSWLALRGIRTLALRIRQHNENALALANFLSQHDAVDTVLFPGLADHEQYDLACKQMDGFGGLFSFVLKDGYKAGVEFIRRLSLAQNAGSLGGIDTLAIQPAAMWGGRLNDEVLLKQGVAPGMIRVATGIEAAEDLLEDFEQALG